MWVGRNGTGTTMGAYCEYTDERNRKQQNSIHEAHLLRCFRPHGEKLIRRTRLVCKFLKRAVFCPPHDERMAIGPIFDTPASNARGQMQPKWFLALQDEVMRRLRSGDYWAARFCEFETALPLAFVIQYLALHNPRQR